MMWTRAGVTVLAAAICVGAFAQSGGPYKQEQDVVYGEHHGVGLLMDVFTPTGEKNGLGIVDIASGAWHSDRGKIRDHDMAGMYRLMCGRGYTVFAIRPGSVTRFTADDMLQSIYRGIRYVKANAEQYGINPDRLGLTGASAGGHLASLATMKPQEGSADASDPIMKHDTRVAAVAIFFPPTNFLQWGDGAPDMQRISQLMFENGLCEEDEADVQAKAREISPVYHVQGELPPFLIWHGDADEVVPLQQSEQLVEKLKENGTPVEFHIKPGGGHPWLTIAEEVGMMAEWFDGQLK